MSDISTQDKFSTDKELQNKAPLNKAPLQNRSTLQNKEPFLIDTHCHLNYTGISERLDEVMQNAREAGIGHMVCISTNLEQTDDMINTVSKYDNVSFTIGQHPCETMNKTEDRCGLTDPSEVYNELDAQISRYKDSDIAYRIVGIGETGLDIHNKELTNQLDIFHAHLEIAIKHNLPVVIHSREMDEQLISSLKTYPNARGVLHCWTGAKETALQAIDMGWIVSFSGIVTFGKKVEYLEEQARDLPLDRIVIETDAPFLAPAPYRGKTNEPSYMKYTAEKIAELRFMNMEKLTESLYQNSLKLFDLKI